VFQHCQFISCSYFLVIICSKNNFCLHCCNIWLSNDLGSHCSSLEALIRGVSWPGAQGMRKEAQGANPMEQQPLWLDSIENACCGNSSISKASGVACIIFGDKAGGFFIICSPCQWPGSLVSQIPWWQSMGGQILDKICG
jgi:hypothetical protein